MDSYRVEKQAAQRVQLADKMPRSIQSNRRRRHKAEPELDRLSNIIRGFNDLFGNIAWEDGDRIRQLIADGDPEQGRRRMLPIRTRSRTPTSRTPASSTTRRLGSVIIGLMKDDTELFKQFSDNPEFKRWLADTIFSATYERAPSSMP